MKNFLRTLFLIIVAAILIQCENKKKPTVVQQDTEVVKNNNKSSKVILIDKPINSSTPEGMVWIPGGTFQQGAVNQDRMAMNTEKPTHQVSIDGFFMDITEVTNTQFAKFIKETGYITVAERAIDWEEMKKQLPEGTPKIHDSILQPGALVFKQTKKSVPNLYDFSQWWEWKIGASWKHPNGPESSILGKENEPVVQVSYEDAVAYCNWAGRRLPTEAEWERAARGKHINSIYFWGDSSEDLSKKANTWEGEFPVKNNKLDGFERRSPVKSYPPNDYGLYDMAGNVWEWTADWYNTQYYEILKSKKEITINPKGATKAYNPNNPYIAEKVIRGGSFLCSDSYCASYRVSARMGTSADSSLEHLGFRTVLSVDMITDKE